MEGGGPRKRERESERAREDASTLFSMNVFVWVHACGRFKRKRQTARSDFESPPQRGFPRTTTTTTLTCSTESFSACKCAVLRRVVRNCVSKDWAPEP